MRLERYRKVQIIHRDDFHYYLPQVFKLSLLKIPMQYPENRS